METCCNKKTEYNLVDIFKLICAVLVVIIHTKPFESVFWIDAAIGIVTRFAVPYFFTSSSYFLFKKILGSENKEKIYIQYFKRLIRFYLVWYIAFNTVSFFKGYIYHPVEYIKQFAFSTNGSPLWFLCALIWASLFVYLLSNKINKKAIMVIAALSWIVGYIFSTLRVLFVGNYFFDLVNNSVISFIGTQNGLFFAFPYVAMGALLAESTITKANKLNAIGILCSMLLLSLESIVAVMVLHADLTFLWLSALPLAYFTIKFTLTNNLNINIDFYVVRKVSTLLYVTHVMFMQSVKFVIMRFEVNDPYNLWCFVGTLSVSLLCSYLLVRLSKRCSLIKYVM